MEDARDVMPPEVEGKRPGGNKRTILIVIGIAVILICAGIWGWSKLSGNSDEPADRVADSVQTAEAEKKALAKFLKEPVTREEFGIMIKDLGGRVRHLETEMTNMKAASPESVSTSTAPATPAQVPASVVPPAARDTLSQSTARVDSANVTPPVKKRKLPTSF